MSHALQVVTDLESELQTRSEVTQLSPALLRAVYLRELASGPTATVVAGLNRVDNFICYALVRDTTRGRDRDLAPAVTPHLG